MPAQPTTLTGNEASGTGHQYNSWMKLVAQHVEDLRFGSVVITVHEGRVVQVEVSTKVRFEKVEKVQ
ncbi:MAG: YezD family protein [Terrimicrobiaceae bacterium]